MKAIIALFFATKYWQDKSEIEKVSGIISKSFALTETITVIDGEVSVLDKYKDHDTIIIVPCSGSVQPDIIKGSAGFKNKVIFAPYVEGNFDVATTNKILYANAAPTLMDVYSVLKRDEDIRLIKTTDRLKKYLKAAAAAEKLKNSRLAVIGETEPWVISSERDMGVYERFGIEIVRVPQKELAELYNTVEESDARYIYDYFKNGADKIEEPNDTDIQNAARMAHAMLKILGKYKCCGLAIACFDLITKTAINPCLGVSYINGQTPYFAGCEGDVDSAVTMLFMRTLTDQSPWMANPNLQKDNSINFVHCTAPIGSNKYVLRNHHETGIGASLQVMYETGQDVVLLRYSGHLNTLSINKGKTVPGRYEPSCRTQVRVELQDFDKYINNVMGCHQVISFTDIAQEMEELAKSLGIRVIS